MAYSRAAEAHAETDGVSKRLVHAVKDAWAGYWVRKAERATALVLHSLSDRTLKDIGMHRSEIESVVCNEVRRNGRQPTRRIQVCA
jgi:uncharacterized protein YjiS (DUF1127 family)